VTELSVGGVRDRGLRGGVSRGDLLVTRVFRRAPYALLGLGLALSLLTADMFDRSGSKPWLVGLAVVAGLLHLVCVDLRWGRPLDDRVGHAYVAARWALAFAMTWVNPFFAVFAVAGYFDVHLYVSRRWGSVVLVATAVTMAGSQSGGLPPGSWMQLGAFVALFALNAGCALFFGRLADHEARLADERDDTIVRLGAALAENAELQARLVEQAREGGVRDERERLALEIHDTIAQSLIGVVTQLQAAGEAVDPADARTHHHRAADLAREALGEARRSVNELLPRRLDDADLETALSALVDDWSGTTGIPADVVVTGAAEDLHRDIDATVLRVAQESLANVGKHAGAHRVGVTLSYMGSELTLDVRDDGVGFDPAAVVPGADSGVGLVGMRRRAARLAGDLVVESEPGEGTAVSLRVPAVGRG
jgi:signal transduction histidine kinase